jgi:hypothetical protein
VYGPVVSWSLGKLAGSVKRVDDPHPPAPQPGLVVDAFLREDPIGWESIRQLTDKEIVRFPVAGSLQLIAIELSCPQHEQSLACLSGELERYRVIFL